MRGLSSRWPCRVAPDRAVHGGAAGPVVPPRAVPGAASAAVAVIGVVLGVALLRLATLVLALQEGDIGLHVDEAQYWHWSQSLAWGYYSKPPVIAGLIAVVAGWWGDGLVAIKAVGGLLYPLAALSLAWLAWMLARDSRPVPHGVHGPAGVDPSGRAAVYAAALFMASPLVALLGLSATTDAPLLLCWSLASALLWRACRAGGRGRALAWWAVLGAVCGLGLLSKYSFAAWLPGAAWWCWHNRSGPDRGEAAAPRGIAPGPWMAAAVVVAMLLPHLAWNADHGWPTIQHTVDITLVGGAAQNRFRVGDAALRVGQVGGGFWVMLGPLWLLWLPWLMRRSPESRQPQAQRFLLALHLPLGLLGLAQAVSGPSQINWTAPLVPGAVLWLALRLSAPRPAEARPDWRVAALVITLALHLALGAAVPLAQRLWRATHDDVAAAATPLPRHLDIWARMRGWPEAFAALQGAAAAHLAQWPGSPVIGTSRTLIAQGAYLWRDLQPHWMAWAPPGPPHNHYELTARWRAAATAGPVLIVSQGPLPAGLLALLDGPQRLAQASAPAAGHSVVQIELWVAMPRLGAAVSPRLPVVPTLTVGSRT